MAIVIAVGDDALENYFASAVQQRPSSSIDLARRHDARAFVKVVSRCTAVDQDVDKVSVVVVVVVGYGYYRRYEDHTVESPLFIVSVEDMCRIVLELPAEVDGLLFTLSKLPSACCQ